MIGSGCMEDKTALNCGETADKTMLCDESSMLASDYIFSSSFSRRSQHIFCEEIDVKELKSQFQQSLEGQERQTTPFYAFSKKAIEENVR